MKHATLTDFLTDAQIETCKGLWGKPDFNKNVLKQVIEPNLKAINRKLGQENDARYLAYAVEYVFNQASQ